MEMIKDRAKKPYLKKQSRCRSTLSIDVGKNGGITRASSKTKLRPRYVPPMPEMIHADRRYHVQSQLKGARWSACQKQKESSPHNLYDKYISKSQAAKSKMNTRRSDGTQYAHSTIGRGVNYTRKV